VRVTVGSTNPVKINSVKKAFEKIFRDVEVQGIKVKSGVSNQPIGFDETLNGAENRARACMREGVDFSVGLEGGIAKEKGKWFSFGVCYIIRRDNKKGIGVTSWFQLPKKVIEKIQKDKKELGEVMDELENDTNTKQKGGAISFFTKGIKDRTKLYEEAVINALIPFIREEFEF